MIHKTSLGLSCPIGMATGATAEAQKTKRLHETRLQAPASLHEVDNGKIMGFGADLAEDHPGYRDAAYKRRRMDIATLARSHEV